MSDLASSGRKILEHVRNVYAEVAKLESGSTLRQVTLDHLLEVLGNLDSDVERLVVRADDTESELADLLLNTRSFCVVCWTSSYAPCEREHDGSVPDGKGGWMYCKMCGAHDEILKLKRGIGRSTGF